MSIGDILSSHKRKKSSIIDWLEVGRRIRELRGFETTQSEFASRIGITQGFLSHVERGEKEISPEILVKISQEFRKSIDWLLTGMECRERK